MTSNTGNVGEPRTHLQQVATATLRCVMLPLDEPTLTELRRRYEEAVDAETRSRYHMLLRSLRGQTSSQIAQIVLHARAA